MTVSETVVVTVISVLKEIFFVVDSRRAKLDFDRSVDVGRSGELLAEKRKSITKIEQGQ